MSGLPIPPQGDFGRHLASQLLAPHVEAQAAGGVGAEGAGEVIRLRLLQESFRVALCRAYAGEALAPAGHDIHGPHDLVHRADDKGIGHFFSFFPGLHRGGQVGARHPRYFGRRLSRERPWCLSRQPFLTPLQLSGLSSPHEQAMEPLLEWKRRYAIISRNASTLVFTRPSVEVEYSSSR